MKVYLKNQVKNSQQDARLYHIENNLELHTSYKKPRMANRVKHYMEQDL